MRKQKCLWNLVVFIAIACSAACALAHGVSHASASDARPECSKPSWLRIEAFVNVPLIGADVSVYDSAGRRLLERSDATNPRGVFPARLRLPRDFRVTATFNREDQPDATLGALGQFTLSADVHDYDPVYGVVYVNPVTTLVSKVMDRQAWPDLSRAQARVRRLLSLPQGSALGASLRETAGYEYGYFSESAFVQAAKQHGGMNAYLDQLALDALNPKRTPYSFAGQRAPGEDGVASFIAQQLASGAIEWAEGEGLGWVLQSTGISTPGATQAEIEKMQQSLADLQSSVEALSNQLDALNRAVLGKLSKVQYTQIAVPALALSAQVNGIGQSLSFFAQGCPPLVNPSTTPPSTYCTNEKVTLLAALNTVSINQSFATLSTYMLDHSAAGVHGMLHLYSEALGESLPFFRPSDSVRLQEMYAFWRAAQIQAAELQVELLHVNGAQNNPGGIAQLYAFLGNANAQPPTQGVFQQTFTAEAKLLFPAVPNGTVISTTDHTMWLVTAPVLYYDGGPYVVFCGPPPSGSIKKTPITSPLSIMGLNWVSPSVTEAQALVSGWSGSNPNQWLTANTQSSNQPTSAGFGNYLISDPLECNKLDVSPSTVWTRTGSALDLSSGHIVSVSSNTYNWILLDRQLASGEQYYWYQGQ